MIYNTVPFCTIFPVNAVTVAGAVIELRWWDLHE